MKKNKLSLVQFCIAVGIVHAFSFHAASTLRYHVHNLQTKPYLLRSIYSTRISITSDDACDATKFNSTTTSYLSGNQSTPEIQRTLYEILDASPNATRNELKQAYIKLARKTHPDAIRHKDDEEQPNESNYAVDFNEVAQAWRTLSNPLERKRYDRKLQAKAFTRNVEMYVGTFSRRAGPPVRKAFEISMPILRKTTAATIAGFEIVRTVVETKGKRSNSDKISEKNKNMVLDNDVMPDLVRSQNDQYEIIRNKKKSDSLGGAASSKYGESAGDSQEMSELVESNGGTKIPSREEYRKAFVVQNNIIDRAESLEASGQTMDIDKSMRTADATQKEETVKVNHPKKSKARNPVRKEKANVITAEIKSDSATVQKSVQYENVERSAESKVTKEEGIKRTDHDTETVMKSKTLQGSKFSQNSSQTSRQSDSAKRSGGSYVKSKERSKISDKVTEIEIKSANLQESKSPENANQALIQSEPALRTVESKVKKKEKAEKTSRTIRNEIKSPNSQRSKTSKNDILTFRQSEPTNRSGKSKTTKKERKKTDQATENQIKSASLQGSNGRTPRLSKPEKKMGKDKVTKKERTKMTDRATEIETNVVIQGSKPSENDILSFRQSKPAKRSSESNVTSKKRIKETDRVTGTEIKPETLQGSESKNDIPMFSQSKTAKRSGESKVTKKEIKIKTDPATDIEMKFTTLQGSKSSKKARRSGSKKRSGESKVTKKERIKKTGRSTKTEMSNDKSGSKSISAKNTRKYKIRKYEKRTEARVGDMPDSLNATQRNVDRTKTVRDKKEAKGFQRQLQKGSAKAGKKRRQKRGKR